MQFSCCRLLALEQSEAKLKSELEQRRHADEQAKQLRANEAEVTKALQELSEGHAPLNKQLQELNKRLMEMQAEHERAEAEAQQQVRAHTRQSL
jgi:chromosome segregation ATPase